ncbi:hypothetical protein [Gordonia sihwensis]|uniref:hypothetical protein n=1 Tax=Gordonia sihwensis TaxID=173559 RepID=UPI003D967635
MSAIRLQTRASGLSIQQSEQAYQLAWVQLAHGAWRALMSVELHSPNGATALSTCLLAPPQAVRLP